MPSGKSDSKSSGSQKAPPSINAHYGLHQHGYIVGKTLGSGAYAKVKTATSVKLNKQVAIKVIDKKSAPKDVITKFLPREIHALKTIDHENVVKLVDVINTENQVFLVMELAEFGDLLDYINARRYLSEATARTLFGDLVSAISKCHSLGIVHRDLKCENLLLDSQLRLKVSDFGFARTHCGQNLETYCGSYAYAAPEVILGNPYDGEKADVWSMGVVLYAMVVGKLPFRDTDVKSLLGDIATRLYYPSRLSEELKDFIKKMLVFDPKERMSVSEMKSHSWLKKTVESEKTILVKDCPER